MRQLSSSNSVFVLEDDIHAEWGGEFRSFDEALSEIRVRSKIAWDQQPNICPCQNWKECGREYSIVEFDSSTTPWTELDRIPVLSVSAKAVSWEAGFEANPSPGDDA